MRPFQILSALLLILGSSMAARADHAVTTAPDLLRRIAPLVEGACGAKFVRPPVVRELTGEAAMKLFAADVRPELERRYAGVTEGQMRYLMRVAATSSVQSCVARYSVSGKAIVLVRSGFDRQRRALELPEDQAPALLAAALSHECVHALDDARFDLLTLFRTAKNEEALRAVNMVAEGRAVYFGRRVAGILRVPGAIANHLPGGKDPSGETEWRLALTYRYGLGFVENLVKRGGIALADRALREPPTVTHFVCQPDRWPDGGIPVDAQAHREALGAFGAPNRVARLSELMLRIRYANLHGLEMSRALFAGFVDGSQVIVGKSNVAILYFVDAASALGYAERSRQEPATRVHGPGKHPVVVRVSGPDAAEVMARVREAFAASFR